MRGAKRKPRIPKDRPNREGLNLKHCEEVPGLCATIAGPGRFPAHGASVSEIEAAIRPRHHTKAKALLHTFKAARPAPMPKYIEPLFATLRDRPPVGEIGSAKLSSTVIGFSFMSNSQRLRQDSGEDRSDACDSGGEEAIDQRVAALSACGNGGNGR